MLGLLAAAAFIALNGFFVAAEFALVKLRATYQGRAVAPDDMVGQAVAKIDRYLSVTQLGITLASLGLGWIGEPTIAHLGEDLFLRVAKRPAGETAETVIVVISFALLTYGHVVLGELVPKLIAIQRSQAVAKVAVWPLRIAFYAMWPGLWLLETSSRVILARLGIHMDAHAEARLSEEEIVGILALHVAQGHGADAKQDIVRRMMRFSQRKAKQAMVPRVDVHSLPISASGKEALEFFRQHQFSRVPLSKGPELDEVVGYVYGKDFFSEPSNVDLASLESLRRDVLFVPESQELVNVLRAMQKSQTPLAMVVDEYGGAEGLLTMEDLLEEIVGEIRDELDEETQRIEKKGDVWEVDGGVLLDELHVIGLSLGDHGPATTMGGAVLTKLGRLPRLGDFAILGEARAEVIAIARRRIQRVRVSPVPKPASEA